MADLDIPFKRWKNHPRPGIDFPDSAPISAEGDICTSVVDAFSEHVAPDVELIVGIDMGGYGLAGALAYKCQIGFVYVRKVSNVNSDMMRTLTANYTIGDGLAISKANRLAGRKVVVLDDCLLSGSTALATIRLLRRLGADCTTALFVYAIEGLDGSTLLANEGITSHILRYLPASSKDDALETLVR